MKDLKIAMKAHLKSNNASWQYLKKNKSNIFFNNPVGYIYQKKFSTTLFLNGKKFHFKNKNIFEVRKMKLKEFVLIGYFSYEFNIEPSTAPYKAIFNIYPSGNFSIKRFPKIKKLKSNRLNKILPDISFINSVKKIKQHIASGDIYQINLTRDFEYETSQPSYDLFVNYYKSQPVDLASYIEFHDHILISGSMELFLSKRGKDLLSKPIKGTRKNSQSRVKDSLSKDVKEKAENLMIVDLMRNDLSQICQTGTVKAKKMFKERSYATLTQLESTVEGKLKKNVTLQSIFEKLMPPGSVTGTPKSEAIKIIGEMEKHYRGPYCGAIGIIEPNDDFCFSVGIRISVLTTKNKKYFSGAGIVWDSKPKKENKETLLKAEAFQNTLSNL
ncbi:MAG: anthranilate synthase component I family protein [Candidatus Dadabacteria bacterium]|nr:anthranilate synthase component I family protein [Candidatus Dadabacteria bacterium]